MNSQDYLVADIVMDCDDENYRESNTELSYYEWLDRVRWIENVRETTGYAPKKTSAVLINHTLREYACLKPDLVPVMLQFLTGAESWQMEDQITVAPRYDRKLYDYSLPGSVYMLLKEKGLII
nr:hypothetical protein K-LCC10_0306 [Kaumoebavirus]